MDFGIDGHIEVVANREPTGNLIAVQIKSGPSYFRSKDPNGITFRGTAAHLEYWLKHDLPVIVVLHDPVSDDAYWQVVTPRNVTPTPRGWKISVPRSQKLDLAHAPALEAIASNNEYLRAVAREFTCPHCGAALLERGGGDILYESYACGYTIQDMCQRPCPLDPAFPRFEEYTLEVRESEPGPQMSYLCIPVPTSAAAKRLRLAPAYAASKEQAQKAVRAEYDKYSSKRAPQH
jgi:hypothetical protein